MQSTLSAHLNYLQQKIQELSDRLTLPASDQERTLIQQRLQLADESLKHYQRAYELERAIDQNPPIVSTR